MHDTPVALITGANKGIGLQIARDVAVHGFTVLVGSRDFEHGKTAAKSVGADAHALQLDVTNESSIAAAEESLGVYESAEETQRLTQLLQSLREQHDSLNAEWEELVQQLEQQAI